MYISIRNSYESHFLGLGQGRTYIRMYVHTYVRTYGNVDGIVAVGMHVCVGVWVGA